MTYKLRILPAALKEWEKLGAPIRSQFKKKLVERLENPRVPADQLSGYDSVYKIKLRSAGYRLAYEVVDDEPGFMLEKSFINSAPIFLAALIAAYITGPFFKNAGVGVYWRTAIYSLVGVGGGLWAYSAYDIPGRSIEVVEAITLGAAMFIYAAVIIGAFVLFKNRKRAQNGEGE